MLPEKQIYWYCTTLKLVVSLNKMCQNVLILIYHSSLVAFR